MDTEKLVKVGQVEVKGDYPSKIIYTVLAIWAIKSLSEIMIIFLLAHLSGDRVDLGIGAVALAKVSQMIGGFVARKKIGGA